MAVFRVERNKGYTVMSNHHLRNAALSLKSKGLLSQMLSLPPEWDYTLKGLSHINRENIDAIRTAIQELEHAGYITRSRERDEKGQLRGAEYIIREQPEPGDPDGGNSRYPGSGGGDNGGEPTQGFPTSDLPMSENPTQGNPTQLNKEELITKKSNTDLLNIESNPIQSSNPSPLKKREKSGTDRNGAIAAYREVIEDNIEYPYMIERYDKREVDEIVDLMLETVCTARTTIRVAGDDYPAELVKSKLLKLNSMHIEYVFECMKENTTEVRNIKKYMLAVLFNAPSTIDSYYSARVRHDLYGG
ncbi:transposase [Clostridia bacterium]|nr:transposase [Clostridia bacterium]